MNNSLVLAYHAVSPSWPSPLAVSPDRFREQLECLVNQGYRGASFTEVVRGELPGKVLAVTFDDGYRTVIDHALPVLSELGLPATIFVPTDYVGRERPLCWPGIEQWVGGEHEPELRCVDWDDLRQLRAEGWEVGSHTRTHPRLTELSDKAVLAELRESREACASELGASCSSFAFPYGDVDERVRERVVEAGYTAAAMMRLGPEDPFCWPRVGVYPIDQPWRFRLKTSQAVGRVRAMRFGQLAEGARFAIPPGLQPLIEEASGGLLAFS
jgi:peptidoglycan/xylan/chitin deacetylase (PgdA/CDA1 family)